MSVETFSLTTARLRLREMTLDDAPFIVDLLGDAAFKRYIGDKRVRNRPQACKYLQAGPLASYRDFGFGLWLVVQRQDDRPVGMCGLLKRPTLDDVDLGFALMPEFRGRGYCLEAATAVLQFGQQRFGLRRIVAIVQPDNERSVKVLLRLGMQPERLLRLGDDPREVQLLAWQA